MTNDAASLARNTTAPAISSGLPQRPGFAAETARDYRDLLIRVQPGTQPADAEAAATRTLALITGLLLDLLADGDTDRVTAAWEAGRRSGART